MLSNRTKRILDLVKKDELSSAPNVQNVDDNDHLHASNDLDYAGNANSTGTRKIGDEIDVDLNSSKDENSDLDEPYEDSGSDYEPVNDNENSSNSENETQITENKTRKRAKKHDIEKSKWKRNINKNKRMRGELYSSLKLNAEKKYETVPRDERKMGDPCQCLMSKKSSKFFCDSFTEEDRSKSFQSFWKCMTWPEKKIYVSALVDIAPIKSRKTENMENHRQGAFVFHLKQNNIRKRVCKKMFLQTLSVGEWSVQNWVKENSKQLPEANVQKKIRHVSKKDSAEKSFVVQFLNNLPKMESHYCRKDSSKLYLEPMWKNINELYRFYVRECKELPCRALSHTSFRKEFELQNLSLFHPKKDQCDTCTKRQVGNIGEEEFNMHIKHKDAARAEKERQKAAAQTDESKLIFTMDVQAVLTVPKLQVSASYYKMKLVVHNFTFYNLVSGKGDCYLWHEGSGKTTANEFASIIIYQIEKYFNPKIKEIIIFSDGCGYQNRNATLANALSYFAEQKNIEVFQYFLEKGHTQMECDSMHASIERKMKYRDIYVPGCFVEICRTAKIQNQYDVLYLDHTFFKNYSLINKYASIRPGKSKVCDIRCLTYYRDGSIGYKISYDEEWIKLTITASRNKSLSANTASFPAPPLYTSAPKIKQEKFDHLQELKQYLPQDFRYFYETLTC